MGANKEARQHIVALVQRLHGFGHHTEDHQLELWHWLSGTVKLPEVERQLARNQQVMVIEYDQVMQKLFEFINQEISQFG